MATDEVVLHGTIRLDSKIRSQNVQFHGSFWREQTLAATKLFFSLTRIDFAVLVSSRAVRISSRAVRVFPALSLRRVRPSYGTFSLMVFQGNCARGRTGHMIKLIITWVSKCLITIELAGYATPQSKSCLICYSDWTEWIKNTMKNKQIYLFHKTLQDCLKDSLVTSN